ncbi:MAG: glutathione transferase [Polyangiaceae bacterium]|nr:glutathione transferase [Polyangiaceae bacterium]
MVTLYVEHKWDSPWVFTVWVALNEKGVPFTFTVLDLERGDQRRAEFAGASLTARVPTVEHEGFWLSESLAIVEYLEESFPSPAFAPCLPRGVRERARARQVMGFLRSDLFQLRKERSTESMFYERASVPLSEQALRDAEKLVGLTERLLIQNEPWLFAEFSCADADLALALGRLRLNGDVLPQEVERYFDRAWERKSVQSFVGQPRPGARAS